MSDKIILKGLFTEFDLRNENPPRYRRYGYRTYKQANRISKIINIFR